MGEKNTDRHHSYVDQMLSVYTRTDPLNRWGAYVRTQREDIKWEDLLARRIERETSRQKKRKERWDEIREAERCLRELFDKETSMLSVVSNLF